MTSTHARQGDTASAAPTHPPGYILYSLLGWLWLRPARLRSLLQSEPSDPRYRSLLEELGGE